MRTPDGAVRDTRTRGDLRVRVELGGTANGDRREAEETIALDAEAAHESLVDAALVAEGEEVELAQGRCLIEVDITANLGTE